MSKGYDIRFVSRNAIDIHRWDRCVNEAANGLIYGSSLYLDHMARQWDGLVLGDYEAVMPLTWNRKYGIAYLYQPFLAAQLGVFGGHLSAPLVEAFLSAVPARFRFWDFYLNHGNLFPLTHYPLYQRQNYVLKLERPYDDLYKEYRESTKRNIRKAGQSGCTIAKDIPVEQVAALMLEQMTGYANEHRGDMQRFLALYKLMEGRGQSATYGVLSPNGELIASCALLFSHQRAYYILVGNHPNGRTLGASHALIDAFIKDRAGQNILLDFEGSDQRNLAFFYSSFGAKEENYAGIKLNRLPFWARWFKK